MKVGRLTRTLSRWLLAAAILAQTGYAVALPACSHGSDAVAADDAHAHHHSALDAVEAPTALECECGCPCLGACLHATSVIPVARTTAGAHAADEVTKVRATIGRRLPPHDHPELRPPAVL